MKQAAYRAALDTACALLRNNLAAFTENFQSSNSEHNFYLPSENVEWTTGFCTGEYWLLYCSAEPNSVYQCDVIEGYLTEEGYTVLMSTHNPEHARRFAADVLALKDGTVYADGPSEETITPALIEALYQIPAAVWEKDGRKEP